MGFTGWPAEAVEFFSGLQADNTKAYWTAHKAVYEESVRGPMAELLGDLSGEFGPGRIARPYRDVRFRADKSPYKTEIYASLDRGGYVRFAADGLTAAVGYYMMSAAQLERYRRAVDDEASGAPVPRYAGAPPRAPWPAACATTAPPASAASRSGPGSGAVRSGDGRCGTRAARS